MKPSSTRLAGIILMCKAAAGFSVMALCVKFASRHLPSMEVVFFRSLIGTIMIGSVIHKRKLPFRGSHKRLMILRAVVGFAALALHFYTIANLDLGTAVLLNYTAPIFTAVLAVLFLKEKLRSFLLLMLLTSFIGVYLLVGAQIISLNTMVLLGLLSGALTGLVYILIRAIHDRESPFTVVFYFTVVSTIGSAFFLPFGFVWPNLLDCFFLTGLGIGSFYGQLWFTMALQKAPASLVSPFSYLVPLLSYIYGLFFFGEKLTPVTCLGALLIIVSGSLISYAEARQNISSQPV